MTSERPLDGVRILALEQMQALPYATQLLARMGADVVKVEPPTGESGRSATPSITDPEGRNVGATFLRNNLNKRTLSIDLKSSEGRDLVLRMAPNFDVVAENSKPGSMAKLGLGYEDVKAVHPDVIYVSVSGFGNTVETPYASWPAYASIVEGMSGIYDLRKLPGMPPRANPVGALGDISAALFATIGLLAALRHKERTGRGQYVDIAMLDAVVAMTDIVSNFWSLGIRDGSLGAVILDTFRADDGWFTIQVGREAHFAKLAEVVGHPEWVTDDRFGTRQGWLDHLDEVLRPAIEAWAEGRTKVEACNVLGDAGIAAGPCFTPEDVVHDPHLHARNMLAAMERPDGGEPVLTPGNPVKLSDVPEQPDRRVPWLGEHTDETLRAELGLSDDELARLRAAGTIS
jgi:formyl-CoA transferase